jgi:MFS family permease
MNFRNRVGLYGSYFLGMAGIGFTLPYLPLYLGEVKGLSARDVSFLYFLAALASLAQFPIGLWSDGVGRRRPFLVALLALLAAATVLLRTTDGGVLWLGLLVILIGENGPCRATVESLAGAEAAYLAPPGQVGAALGALRFWRPVSIVLVALAGGFIAASAGVGAILVPLAVLQTLAAAAGLLIHEGKPAYERETASADGQAVGPPAGGLTDRALWVFVAAMVLFHISNAPPGVYLGLFMSRDLHAERQTLSYLFVISMIAWMLVVRPAGRLADRLGRRPLLVAGWSVMSLRLVLLALATEGWQVLGIQILDGLAQGLFAVTAAAWMTDRLANRRRVGEAQVLVGGSLVFGSAVGPLLTGLVVEELGYRGTFGVLAGVGVAATILVGTLVPETVPARKSLLTLGTGRAMLGACGRRGL